MPTQLACDFRAELDRLRAALLALPPSLADIPWRPGGWTRKQIVGHLIDSATNNRQRFVRAAIDGAYAGPGYAQDDWVLAHGYGSQQWDTLLRWWQTENEILMAAVDQIPEDRLASSCVVGSDAPVTLRFLIEDYLRHHQHHFKQLQAS
ncbi:MAG TPA: DinB family protein [Terracidiphilus sp.]|nr:DinB family protein [Terracidiphilus sp.]